VEVLVLHTPAQHGAAKRSEGVTLAKNAALRIDMRLLDEMWPEVV
jgi:hypothetical protein